MKVKVTQACLTLGDPTDCTVHGFSRPEYWSGSPFPPPGDLSNPGLLHCRRILYRNGVINLSKLESQNGQEHVES